MSNPTTAPEEAVEADAVAISKGSLPSASVTPVAQKRSWLSWHEPGTSKEEKWLIFKIDWFILSYSCLCYFMKQLDQTNVSNAYVSGMKEELGFGPGNELSWMNTYFSIGTILGAVFANPIITIVPPRIWLPSCMLAWSMFVLFLYKCETASQFYALRFCVGFCESVAWPGVMYTLGCWYRKSELARRSGLFVMSGVLGQMFSGYLQSALYSGMEGKGGMSAWRWLFIFDFILGVPVCIYGLLCHPDTPETTKAWYLNDWERKRAADRIREEGRQPSGKLGLDVVRRIFTSWQVYAFTLGYAFWSLTAGSYVMQFFSLYLKSTKMYTVPQINNIPTAIGAVNWFFMVFTGIVSDRLGTRAPACFGVGCLLTFCYAVLAVWHVSHPFRMAAFILVGCYGCYTPLLAGWINEACGGDQHKRSFVLGFVTAIGGAVVIPFQQYQFPSSQAPQFKKTHGWVSGLVFVVALTLWTGIGLPLLEKAMKRREKNKQPVEEDVAAADEIDV